MIEKILHSVHRHIEVLAREEKEKTRAMAL